MTWSRVTLVMTRSIALISVSSLLWVIFHPGGGGLLIRVEEYQGITPTGNIRADREHASKSTGEGLAV